MDSTLAAVVMVSIASIAIALLSHCYRSARTQRDDALALANQALAQRDAGQAELCRAAITTAALLDLVAVAYGWDTAVHAAAQRALVAWLADPPDVVARAVLESAGLPAPWLDEVTLTLRTKELA